MHALAMLVSRSFGVLSKGRYPCLHVEDLVQSCTAYRGGDKHPIPSEEFLASPEWYTLPGPPIIASCLRSGEKENLQERHLNRASISPGPAVKGLMVRR